MQWPHFYVLKQQQNLFLSKVCGVCIACARDLRNLTQVTLCTCSWPRDFLLRALNTTVHMKLQKWGADSLVPDRRLEWLNMASVLPIPHKLDTQMFSCFWCHLRRATRIITCMEFLLSPKLQNCYVDYKMSKVPEWSRWALNWWKYLCLLKPAILVGPSLNFNGALGQL